MSVIRRLDCVETPSGFLLSWDFAEDAQIIRTTVYGIKESRQFAIESPLIPTGRCLVSPRNYHLVESFKVSAVCSNGSVETSDPISPRRLPREQRLILTDLKRRLLTNIKAAPIGAYDAKVFLRRLEGIACDLCTPSVCGGVGGPGAGNSCPICLGTGIQDPYFVYEKTLKMWGVSADDDQPSSVPQAQRSHKTRTFSIPFELHLRPGDLLVAGTEVYKILEHTVPVSVGGVPVTLTVTALKYEPHDERHPIILEMSQVHK